MNYILVVKETGSKAAKYFYSVVDESGMVVSTRTSNRVYVACTIDGSYYFGRVDLVGKGGHGAQVKYSISQGITPTPVAYTQLKY